MHTSEEEYLIILENVCEINYCNHEFVCMLIYLGVYVYYSSEAT